MGSAATPVWSVFAMTPRESSRIEYSLNLASVGLLRICAHETNDGCGSYCGWSHPVGHPCACRDPDRDVGSERTRNGSERMGRAGRLPLGTAR